MARKDVLPHKVATAQSLTTSFNSEPTTITYLDNVAYQINVTTSNSTGTFAVQGSLDYKVDGPTGVVTPGNWISLTLSGTPVAAGANDQIIISMNQVPFNALRIAYTAVTPGTGTCDIYILAKQVGG